MNRTRHRHPVLIAMLSIIAVSGLVEHGTSAFAASTRDASQPEVSTHSLSDLKWLAGAWRGNGLGGHCEETWSEAAGGAMIGMFRLLQDDQVVFYEFMRIFEEDGAITLEIKHFTPKFVGWEEKSDAIRFPLLEAGDGFAVFDGLTMKRTDDGGLAIAVVLDHKDGSTKEEHVRLWPAER